MISEIEPSLGLDPITDGCEKRGGGRTRRAPRGSSQSFPHAVSHHCTKRTPRDYPWYDNRGRSLCNNSLESRSRRMGRNVSGHERFLLRRLERGEEFLLCKDAVVVRVGRIEIGGDGRMCLRFSPGQFSCMTHVQLVKYCPELGLLRR